MKLRNERHFVATSLDPRGRKFVDKYGKHKTERPFYANKLRDSFDSNVEAKSWARGRRRMRETSQEDFVPWDRHGPMPSKLVDTHPVTAPDMEELPFEPSDSYTSDTALDGLFRHYNDTTDKDFEIKRAREDEDSTITVEEQQAFKTIFKEIQSQTAKAAEKNDIVDELSALLGEAAAEKHAKESEDAPTTFTSRSRQAQRPSADAIQAFPKALRAAAAKALGLGPKPEAALEEVEGIEPALEKVDPHLETRKAEFRRITKMMEGAETDIELWNVLETEVFSIVPRLELDNKPLEPPKPAPASESKRGKKASATATPAETASPLDFDIYAPLYPVLVHHALKALSTSYGPRPSPLAYHLLPRLKSLGLLSTVLGSSTPLYVSLIRLHKTHRTDLPAIHALLADMAKSGLEFDASVIEVLDEIVKEYNDVRRGEKGHLAQVVYQTLPEFATGMALRKWLGRLKEARKRGELGSAYIDGLV
jgi:hypothetical protein